MASIAAPVLAEMPGDQRHMIVTVMGGDLVDVGVLGDEPARGHYRLAGRLQRGPLLSGVRPAFTPSGSMPSSTDR